MLLLIAFAARADLVDDYFTRLEAHGFSGVVLVARGPDVVLRKAYGLADKKRGIAMQPDFAFSIASLDKQFIAAGIVRLEEQGKLKTTDPLSRFFTQLPADRASVTLHQVLSHTAGFPDEYWDAYPELTRAQFIERVLRDKPLRPGRFRYTSFDYWLLEEVIERASGKPFEQFLRDEFFEPLGMTMTGAALPKWNRDKVAQYQLWTIDASQLPGEGHFSNPIDRPPAWRVMVSTADDLFRWYLAIRDGRVLTAASRAKWMTPVMEHYAYGWWVVPTIRGTHLVHHGGGGNYVGNVATFRWFVDEDTLVVILNNSMMGGFNTDYVMNDLEPMLFPATPSPPATTIEAASYRLPKGGVIDVIPTNGRVIARSRDAEAIAALRFGGVDDGGVALQRTFVYEGVPEIQTYVRVRDDFVRVITTSSERAGVERIDLGPGIEVVLAPAAGGDFSTWEARLGTGVRVHFSPGAMRITGAGGSVEAKRIER